MNKLISKQLWDKLFESVIFRNISLSCNFVLVYKDVWENIENKISQYISDKRREWDNVEILPTDRWDTFLMVFSSQKRDEHVEILIEIAEELEDAYVLKAFSLVPGNLRKSTLESFVNATKGMWLPRLRYNFMDELSGRFQELFKGAKIDMSEFIINVFKEEKNGFLYQKTMRVWVENDGDREYDILKSMNLDRKRIVNLKAGRFIITLPNKEKIDFRVDHTSRLLLSSRHINEFRKILGIIQDEIIREFRTYKLKQLLVRDKIGNIPYVKFSGANTLKIIVDTEDWFEKFASVLRNAESLIDDEKLVPLILVDEKNPVLHVQLIDLEAQSNTNVYLNKEQGEIVLAPQSFESSIESISKIVNLLEKTLGAEKVRITKSGG